MGEEKKAQGPVRHVLTSNPRLNPMSQGARGTTTIQLLDKSQAKLSKAITTGRPSAGGSAVLHPQMVTRPQVRTLPRNPTIIKTSPRPRTAMSQSVRPQKFALSQNSGKFVTSSGANIILLENTAGQGRPVIVPLSGTKRTMPSVLTVLYLLFSFLGSSGKVPAQIKTTPQKITKPALSTPAKSPAVTKLAMSKKIISTNSLLQQRQVLVRNRTVTSTKIARQEAAGIKFQEAGSSSDLMEIPVYFTEEEGEEQLIVEDQPVVIPIIDSSKMKSKKSLPKDISYTEDGDSISFPLDYEIDAAEDDSTVKVLIGTVNRVVKTPQVYVTKPGSSAKKVKTFVHSKTIDDQGSTRQGQVFVNERQEAKYFSEFFSFNQSK